MPACLLNGCFAVVGDRYLKAVLDEDDPERVRDLPFVVDNQDHRLI
ncbi:MAG TPA: hypothetical protein VJU82_07525 [Acidobacteriaceae bacterium]|nr:hypothetical protein [Acidobacteriaceae bacterium]